MDHHYKGLIAALALSAGSAFAGYAQATPPAAWSSGGGAGGSFSGTKAANGATFFSGSVSTNASLNVGGRAVSMPATMRFAANAPRVAAAAIMLHPGIRTAASIAGWLGLAGLLYDPISGLWTAPDDGTLPDDVYQSDGSNWSVSWWGVTYTASSASAACSKVSGPTIVSSVYDPRWGGFCDIQYYSNKELYPDWIVGGAPMVNNTGPSSCPSGWYVTPAGCVQTPPPKTLTQEEAVEEIIKHPMPDEVPRHIPVPLPVEQPNIQPVFIPTGDPVTNPNFNPSEAPSPSNPPQVQPGVEAKPAPAPGSPWQVETTPVNRPVEDPNAPPSREPQPLPDTGGGPTGNEPKDPDKADFCEKYPTVIACQELKHEDDDTKLPEKAIDLDFNPIPGFQGAKSCPAFPNIGNALHGRQISWQPFCDQLGAISNLLLALAWLYAAWILYSSRGD
jgi:hypothetical protein